MSLSDSLYILANADQLFCFFPIIAPVPGTTLNLLKFPILRPEPGQLNQRYSRLSDDKVVIEQMEQERIENLRKTKSIDVSIELSLDFEF